MVRPNIHFFLFCAISDHNIASVRHNTILGTVPRLVWNVSVKGFAF